MYPPLESDNSACATFVRHVSSGCGLVSYAPSKWWW